MSLCSPFPSPGSAFLSPPAPDAHEFALRPTPARVPIRSSSLAVSPTPPVHPRRPLSQPEPALHRPPTAHRPAPPSPALSRRVSQTSRPNSLHRASATSFCSDNRQLSAKLQALFHPHPHSTFQHQQHQPPTYDPSGSSSPILVRDYAYADADERHRGLGADVPYLNRIDILFRRLRGEYTDDGDEDELEDSEIENDDHGDMWGTLNVGRFGRLDDDEDVEMRHHVEHDQAREDNADDEPPLLPGLYRALYPFEPEGTAEMALVEDQLVKVVGRGGGVGWAVVVMDNDEEHPDGPWRHALVPESYLEVWRLDGEE